MARSLESLWNRYLDDSSQWWDYRNSSKALDFKRKITKESLSLDAWCSPPWIDQEVRRRLKFIDDDGIKATNEEALYIVHLLKACAKEEDIFIGSNLHSYIQEHKLLQKHCHIASCLVNMYARCGALTKAQAVLDELPVRDVVMWNALIAGYTQQAHGQEALACFHSMQCEGFSPNAVSIICALKACGSIEAASKCEQIHNKIANSGLLEKDVMIGNTLVDTYAKCGALPKAQQLFEELFTHNIVTWTALMTGYVRHEQDNEALKCFDRMICEGYSPNAVTFNCALKACASVGAAVKGEQIHDMIISLGLLGKDIVLGSTLVEMYARCGALAKAQQVVEELPARDVIMWNTLIEGYIEQGQGEKALKCFECMLQEGHSPNAVSFICALSACGCIGSATRGEKIHDMIVKLGLLEKDIILGNALLNMYARCGVLVKAQQVLSELPVRDLLSWTALIAGYVQQGQGEEALKCFDSMQQEGHSPNAVTFICALKACGCVGSAIKGKEVHDKIISLGILEEDSVLGNTLVNMYARCGALAKAHEVFDKLPVRNTVSWYALIAGYSQLGQDVEALECFDSMQCEGHCPDAVIFTCALKACGNIGATTKGEQIHMIVAKLGMLEKNIVLGSTLVDMYARCGVLPKALQVLEELPARNVISWTALIAGYVQQGQGKEALRCFDSMQCEGHSPNATTLICALKACGKIGVAAKGEQIHEKIITLGLLEKDIALGCALVDMYATCGALTKAEQVLVEELPVQDVVMWNALLAGYVEQGQDEKALKCFDNVQCEGHSPDAVTLTCALKACGSIGAISKGKQIYDNIKSSGLLKKDIALLNTLLDMYGKCAAFDKAAQVLEEFPIQDVVTWNVLIGGFAQQGHCAEALTCFGKMQSKGIVPDSTTLVCVLNACSHLGLLDHGEMYILKMNTRYGIMLDVEYHCCLVDLFGRAGKLDKALIAVQKMPSADYPLVWLALLGACQKWGNVKIGSLVFENALWLGANSAATYVCMTNICTAAPCNIVQ